MNKVWVLIIVILAFFVGYTTKSLIKTTEKTPNNPIALPSKVVTPTDFPSSEEVAKSVVIKFEDLQKVRNSDILKLFTPSSSNDEADTYSFLLALDLENSSPRLFKTAGFGYKVTEYKLGSILKAERGFRVEVEETRSSYDNMGGGWVDDGKKIYVFELVQIGGNVMIDKYYPKKGNNGKYDGFYS
ncbi:hypothetical protein COV53_01500 [Candidatus Gottesmanbacteria bacterium CG11_big_fil_rev_8_21_14_0_20_37_11]|uniref:Uncharacterized protein n=3 Tax=Candidatus Gottesmaniibacteriota TaxID=1752720 RepID=A0A2M7RPW9_9BACT|nr:MAG: hypothetical protein AUJ73_01120 [Candidatus Gottesmanbacteria bacterium CG1_02_37_22]PIP32978.1 MAG: hypothetical protein COX23_01805 [Candidatus Gottesmanbacteria bacterium CG23_combo_of_CG06-09_8_20_14_all_37_19]PIR08727.1 MAG: hypothetical protein COV53_01500 [Candidatus Gottesmanbacteria bacterium CG11_big_fil_rev_8_21_14_0_20_37_11]PIZ02371.1 MAG: hypothetical protein COY59_05140 [Candidatus Gottesmanbacteria bacterium CG_4_10_14_0_8_um_filter_37_24]